MWPQDVFAAGERSDDLVAWAAHGKEGNWRRITEEKKEVELE